jgi:hypothetical protein
VLAVFGALVCGVATVFFAGAATGHQGTTRVVLTVLAVAAFAGLVVAFADLVVLSRRRGTDRV